MRVWCVVGLVWLVAIERMPGRHSEALALYDQAISIREDYADAWTNRGTSLLALGRLDEAEHSWQHALQVRVNDSAALTNRGNLLRKLGRLDEAMSCYDASLAQNLWAADAVVNRAAGLESQAESISGEGPESEARRQEALHAIEYALRLSPHHPEAHINRGAILDRMKTADGVPRREEALLAFQQALLSSPKNSDAWYNHGQTLYRLERFDEALGSLSHALRLNPLDQEASHYVAVIRSTKPGEQQDQRREHRHQQVPMPSRVCTVGTEMYERGGSGGNARMDSDSTVCVECMAGQFDHDRDPHTPCKLCRDGFGSPEGSAICVRGWRGADEQRFAASSGALDLAIGGNGDAGVPDASLGGDVHVSLSNGCECDAGSELAQPQTAQTAPATAVAASMLTTGACKCEDCPAGRYDHDHDGNSRCRQCPGGYGSPSRSLICLLGWASSVRGDNSASEGLLVDSMPAAADVPLHYPA